VNRNTARRRITSIGVGVIVMIVLALSLSVNFSTVSAGANFAAPLCGNGSAPDYGFSYDLQQSHWTVNWENYVSQESVDEVDSVLDSLNADTIAQTMILFQSQDEVGNRVNCAVHFLRYMQLGEVTGERKDNGFVFLIVIEHNSIDVHYGVGLGLPALTAPELTSLNRTAEDTYQSTHSLDQALLSLVHGFDSVARNKYAPLISPTPTPETLTLPSSPLGLLALCGQLCLGLLLLLFLLWLFSQMGRSGINFNPYGSGSFGRGFPTGGGSGGYSPPSRGGSGSGRSGRGN